MLLFSYITEITDNLLIHVVQLNATGEIQNMVW